MGKGTTLKASNASSIAASRVSHSSMKVSHTNIKSKTQTPTSSMTKSINSTGQRLKGMVKSLFGAKPLVQEDIEPSESSSEMIPPITKPTPGKSQGSQTNITPKKHERRSSEEHSTYGTVPTTITTNSPVSQQQEALFPTAIAALATMTNAALAQVLANPQTSAALTSSLVSSQGLSARDLALTTSNLQQPSIEYPASFGASYNSVNKSVAQQPLSINQSSVRPPVTSAEQEYVILPASIINMYIAMKNKGASALQNSMQQVRSATVSHVSPKQAAEPAVKRTVHFEAPSTNTINIPHSTGSIIRGDAFELSAGSAEKEKEGEKEPSSKKVVIHEDHVPAPRPSFGVSETKEEARAQPKSESPKIDSTFIFGKVNFDAANSISQSVDKQNPTDSITSSDTQNKTPTYSFKFGNTSANMESNASSTNTQGFSFSIKKEEPAVADNTAPKLLQADTTSESTSKQGGFIFSSLPTTTEAPKPATSFATAQPVTEQATEQKKEQPTFSFGSMSATTTKGFAFTPSSEEPKSSTTTTTGFSFTAPSSSAKQSGGFSFQVSTPPVQFGAAPSAGNASSTQGIFNNIGSTQPAPFSFGCFNASATNTSSQSVFGVGVSPFATKPSTSNEIQGSKVEPGQFSLTFPNTTVKAQLS